MLHPPNSIHDKEKELMLPTSLYSAQAQIMRRLDFPYKIYGCRDSVRKKLRSFLKYLMVVVHHLHQHFEQEKSVLFKVGSLNT
jgi:hypothetical protein